MKTAFAALAVLALLAVAQNVSIPILDEGVENNTLSTGGIDCRGNGIVCSVEGRTARVTVAGASAAVVFAGTNAACTGTVLADGGGMPTCTASDALNIASIQHEDAGYYRVFLTTAIDDSSYNVQATGSPLMTVGVSELDGGSFALLCSLAIDGGQLSQDCASLRVRVEDFQ